MNKLRAIAIAAGSLFYTLADAAVDVPPSTVLAGSVFSYQTYGGGDVVFQLTQTPLPPSECYGFWLRASDPGFRNNLAILIATIQAQGAVGVTADDTTIWSGSSSKYCLVSSLLL